MVGGVDAGNEAAAGTPGVGDPRSPPSIISTSCTSATLRNMHRDCIGPRENDCCFRRVDGVVGILVKVVTISDGVQSRY